MVPRAACGVSPRRGCPRNAGAVGVHATKARCHGLGLPDQGPVHDRHHGRPQGPPLHPRSNHRAGGYAHSPFAMHRSPRAPTRVGPACPRGHRSSDVPPGATTRWVSTKRALVPMWSHAIAKDRKCRGRACACPCRESDGMPHRRVPTASGRGAARPIGPQMPNRTTGGHKGRPYTTWGRGPGSGAPSQSGCPRNARTCRTPIHHLPGPPLAAPRSLFALIRAAPTNCRR